VSVPISVSGFNAGRPYAVGGVDAGLPIRGLYREADAMFPVLPDEIVVMPDTPASSWGLAWYRGQDDQGRPRFAVRDDVALNPKIAYHESGHAFEDVLRRASGADPWDLFSIGSVDVLGRYWKFRGFPGEWKVAHAAATIGEWGQYPSESWAEAFSAAVSGQVISEWTWAYQRDLALGPGGVYDPTGGALRARVFFLELMREIVPGTEDDLFTDDDRKLLTRVRDLLEAEGPKIWTAREQRGRDVETGKPFDPATPPLDPRIITK
jgi:hypothetical protein